MLCNLWCIKEKKSYINLFCQNTCIAFGKLFLSHTCFLSWISWTRYSYGSTGKSFTSFAIIPWKHIVTNCYKWKLGAHNTSNAHSVFLWSSKHLIYGRVLLCWFHTFFHLKFYAILYSTCITCLDMYTQSHTILIFINACAAKRSVVIKSISSTASSSNVLPHWLVFS